MLTNYNLNRRHMLKGAAALASIAALSGCETHAETSDPWKRIDEAADKVISEKLTPGLSISVMRNGEFLYSKGHGQLNLETKTAMTSTSVFKVASITKQMIGALLLRLEDQRQLSLDDKLSKYLPDFPKADKISLYQLATHTAGLGDYARLPSRPMDQAVEYNDESFLALLMRTDPLFIAEPGTEENYSNTDYGLLGLVINQVTGRHFGQVLQSEFFDPLGLKATGYDHQFEVISGRVSGYSPWQQMPSGFAKGDYIASSYPGPSGAIRSTSEDLCRWHQALVFGDLLKPQSYKKLTAPVSLPNGPSYYGMGVLTVFPRDPFKGRSVVSHGGRISGFATDLWSFPEKKVTVATLFNSDGGDQQNFGKGFDAVRDPATQIALGES